MPARVTETGSYAVILNCQTLHSHHRGTWLVWLHGFLGKGDDWLPVINACNQYASLIIDLPGHGHSADIAVKRGFAEMSELLNATLSEQQVDDYWLMGYSLGGRIAMYHATHGKHDGLRGLLVEGGNPGLFSRQERAVRLQHDWRWAQRFRQEPIDAVLADWYQQSIFADLTLAQREKLIYLRSQNSGKSVAEMLESTSLGHQPWLIPDLQKITTPFVYLCGENDCKFQRIAEQYSLPLKTLPQVGHNAHYGNPVVFSAVVNHFLSLFG